MAKMDASGKRVVARAAKAYNEAGVSLGVMALLAAPWGPAGLASAAVLAAGGAVAAFVGSRLDVAAEVDPPRQDISTVSVFQEKSDKVRLAPPSNDLESALQDMVRQEIFLSEALGDLTLSFERSMEIDSLKRRREKIKGLRRHESAQIEAIILNGKACINLQNRILDLAPRVNLEWYKTSEEFLKTNEELPRYTNKEMHRRFVSLWNEKISPDLSNYGLHDIGFNEQDFLNNLDKQVLSSEMPEAIFSRSWYKSTQQVPDTLARFFKKL